MTDPSGYPVTRLADGDVWVAAPPGITVSLQPVSDAPPSTPEFTVVRIIGNLKFTNSAGRTRFTFNPPARLQVRFYKDDSDKASGRGKRLVLAWWNKAQTRWEPFTEGQVVLEPGVPLDGGNRHFDIPALDDPPIGWGT